MTNLPYTQDPNLQAKIKDIVDHLNSKGFDHIGDGEILKAMFPPQNPDLTDFDILSRSIAHKPKRRAHKLRRK